MNPLAAGGQGAVDNPRPSGWTCEHMTITGGDAQAWEEITGPCGCPMKPFYGDGPGHEESPQHYANRKP